MTVDADVTVEILREIRDEIIATRTELKTEISQVKTELTEFKTEVSEKLDTTNSRLEVVEHTLTDFAQQHLLLTRFVKNVAHRHDDELDELRTRVELLEQGSKK